MADKKDKKDKKAKDSKGTKTVTAKTKSATKKAAPKAPAKADSKRKGKSASKPSAKPVVVTHDQIAQKAYEIWLGKGKPHGQDQQNWDEAKAALEKLIC